MNRARYLTDEEKREHLAYWDSARREFTTERLRLEKKYVERGTILGGLGFPDPDIYDLCDALNALDGICTTQSCSGHRHPEEQAAMDAGENIVSCWSGQLWIRLNAERSDAFWVAPYALADAPGIERVQVIIHKDMGDVLDVIFEGLNIGPEALVQSSASILSYFTGDSSVAEHRPYKPRGEGSIPSRPTN